MVKYALLFDMLRLSPALIPALIGSFFGSNSEKNDTS
jgi:hypothetical protein